MNWSRSSLVGFLLPLICMLFGGCRHSDGPIKNIRSEELRESHGVVNEPTEVFSEGSFENHDVGRELQGWSQFKVDSVSDNESTVYFSQETRELEGQMVVLEGFLIPFSYETEFLSFASFQRGSGTFNRVDTILFVDI